MLILETISQMKKKILFRSRSEAETFRQKLRQEAGQGTFTSVYVQHGKYVVLVSGTFTDTEIHKVLGAGRIVDFD